MGVGWAFSPLPLHWEVAVAWDPIPMALPLSKGIGGPMGTKHMSPLPTASPCERLPVRKDCKVQALAGKEEGVTLSSFHRQGVCRASSNTWAPSLHWQGWCHTASFGRSQSLCQDISCQLKVARTPGSNFRIRNDGRDMLACLERSKFSSNICS